MAVGAAAVRALLCGEIQPQTDTDLRLQGLQEAGSLPVLPDWARGPDDFLEWQLAPRLVDCSRKRNRAQRGNWW